MNETEARLKQEIDALLAAAEKTDAEEDAQYGKDRHGDELPAELQRRESRLQKIGEAKAALEQEAKEQAERKREEVEQKLTEREEEERRTGKKKGGRKPELPDPEQAKPDDTAQRNFTDPESRIMPDGGRKGSFVQAYNAQIAVDSAQQIIVAAEITQESNDTQQLAPMLERVEQNMGTKPEAATADAGYFSEEQVTDKRVDGIELYVAIGKQKHGEGQTPEVTDPGDASVPPAEADSAKENMKRRLKTEAGQALYRMRKAIVEPVFGQIKGARGIRNFLLRGFAKAGAEWKLICATHNLLKLFRSGYRPQMA